MGAPEQSVDPDIIPFCTPLYWRRLQLQYGHWFRYTFGHILHRPFWSIEAGLDIGACDDQIWHSRDDESINEAIIRQWGERTLTVVHILAGTTEVTTRKSEPPHIYQVAEIRHQQEAL
jgi:hypothetical protein